MNLKQTLTRSVLVLILCVTFGIQPISSAEDYSLEQQELHKHSPHEIQAVKYVDKTEVECVKRLLWFESRGENKYSIKAVLSVVLNRKMHKAYPETFCKIEQQAHQFSYIKGNRIPKIKPVDSNEQKKLAEIEDLAYDAVMGGFKPILPRNVLHYVQKDIEQKWLQSKELYAKIGSHKFYLTKDGRI